MVIDLAESLFNLIENAIEFLILNIILSMNKTCDLCSRNVESNKVVELKHKIMFRWPRKIVKKDILYTLINFRV